MTDCLKNKSKKLLMNIFFVLVAFSPLSTYAQSEKCNCKELMRFTRQFQKADSVFNEEILRNLETVGEETTGKVKTKQKENFKKP